MSYRDKKVEVLKLRGNNTNIALVVPPFRASDETLSRIQMSQHLSAAHRYNNMKSFYITFFLSCVLIYRPIVLYAKLEGVKYTSLDCSLLYEGCTILKLSLFLCLTDSLQKLYRLI